MARVRERLHRHGLEGVVGGHVLEDLDGREGRLVLIASAWALLQRTRADLVIPEQPESGSLIMLVVADEAVVRPDLQKILSDGRLHFRPSD